MRLYMAASIKETRRVIDEGFVGIPRTVEYDDGARTEVVEFCEFRGPGIHPNQSAEPDEDDLVLFIEVPDEVAAEHRTNDPLEGHRPPTDETDDPVWAEEYWLPVEEANRFRHTLKVFDPRDGEEVRPDLVGE